MEDSEASSQERDIEDKPEPESNKALTIIVKEEPHDPELDQDTGMADVDYEHMENGPTSPTLTDEEMAQEVSAIIMFLIIFSLSHYNDLGSNPAGNKSCFKSAFSLDMPTRKL